MTLHPIVEIYNIIKKQNIFTAIDVFLYSYLSFFDKYKNTNLLKYLFYFTENYNVEFNKINKLYILCKKSNQYLSKKVYNRHMNITDKNTYTILRMNLDITGLSLQQMAINCLRHIVKSKKILLDNKPIKMNDCIIIDLLQSSLTKFSYFHTDIEYSNFTGNAFNVWYLIENNESFGNMFLLETNTYKKKYTPCLLLDDYTDNLIPIVRQNYSSKLIQQNELPHIGYIKEDDVKITYLNMKNGDCLIMSKHLPHRTDLSRTEQFKGFNFRIIIKNTDGSINYNNKYYHKVKPYHIYDEANKKIYGCKMFDFLH